ncbi:MAG: HAMP domain-containing protein [Cyanobacteria bacterium CRU_2_1]|nr:HAMP domain-containing protein [Cyanobacteria bacterium CRU_2_1]
MTVNSSKPVLRSAKVTSNESIPQIQVNSPINPSFNKRSFWSSLRFKATFLAIAIGTLPVLVIGTAGYSLADRIIREQVRLRQQSDAELVADKVSRFMFERYGDIQILAQQPVFTNPKLRSSTTVAEQEQFLNNYVKAYDSVYSSIEFIDKDGNDIAVSSAAAYENHKNDDYFQGVIATGRPFISQPRFSSSTGTQQIFIAAPVRDSETNQIIGLVQTRVSVAAIKELLSDFEDVGELHFADTSSRIFLSTEEIESDDVPEKNSNEPQEIDEEQDDQSLDEDESSAHVGELANDLFPDLAQLRETATSGVLLTVDAIDQEEELLGYAVLPAIGDLPNLEWFVLVETELEEAFRAQQYLQRTLFVGTLLSLVIIGVVAGVIAHRGVKPIEEAAATVEQFGQGKFETRLAIRGTGEVTTLNINVNWMADQIQALLETLQQNAAQLGQQNTVLSTLARSEALIQGNTREASRAFTEAIAHTLTVERVSIWLYNRDRSVLSDLDQYHLSSQQHTDGSDLNEADFPKYFRTLEFEPFIAADDVYDNPATQELLISELGWSDIQAILNVPIQIAGRTVGIIRCDHLQTVRAWRADEQAFVTSLANLVSIALESEFLQQEVSHLLDVVSEVEDGDLTAQAKVSDRTTGLVADTFNRLIERLSDVLTQVVQAAQQVSARANQQKTMAEIVATNTEQQAQAVNQVLQLTEQVEQAAQGSAEKVNATVVSLQTMSVAVGQGQTAIATLTQGIDVLQEGTDRIVQQMKTLGEFVGLADQFVQDQSQIASLTQTLALNASLVAARASEQRDPRQFAVVAREFDSIANHVSRLAQQTNEGLLTLEQRSTQIHSVVSIIDANIQSLGGLVRGFTEGVDQSSRVFGNVQIVTNNAVNAGETVTQANYAIVNAAQSAAQVVREIATIANKTAELSQQTRMQSEEVDTLSNQLLQSIQFFQLPTGMNDDNDLQPRVDLSQVQETTLDVNSNVELKDISEENRIQSSSELEDLGSKSRTSDRFQISSEAL